MPMAPDPLPQNLPGQEPQLAEIYQQRSEVYNMQQKVMLAEMEMIFEQEYLKFFNCCWRHIQLTK